MFTFSCHPREGGDPVSQAFLDPRLRGDDTEKTVPYKKWNCYFTSSKYSKNSLESISDPTIRLLEYSLRFLSKNKIAELSVSSDDIDKYITALASKQISPRSINRKISTLKSYYNFLISEYHTDYNPTLIVDLPKYSNKLPSVLSIDNMRSLLEFCNNDNCEIPPMSGDNDDQEYAN